jgi:malate dehydrogenase (oxaloacetate-decarboxylating)(NADP+)
MQGGAFNEEVIREMNKHAPRPIIFALSNPTSKSECTPQQAYEWTNGSAIYASGSPFPPANFKGRMFKPSQGNNMYIFPGIGLGATLSDSREVTDAMFFSASKALAGLVSDQELKEGSLYPNLEKIRTISAEIAAAVWKISWAEGKATREVPKNPIQYIKNAMYYPGYIPYEPA